MTKIYPQSLILKKANHHKITMLTAYDYQMAKLIDESGIDVVLVGDSLGNVFSGYDTTIPVTMDQMVYHTAAVARGVSRALLVSDLPFLSYQTSYERAKENAGRLIKEGGAQAIKLEVMSRDLTVVSEILDMGISVMGHIGFTPQKLYQLGGYKKQGKSVEDQNFLVSLAKELEDRGCFAVLLEMVSGNLSKEISSLLSIPVIGIGAGQCDGQVLVSSDMLGITQKVPKFVKRYADGAQIFKDAILNYKHDVENQVFPNTVDDFCKDDYLFI